MTPAAVTVRLLALASLGCSTDLPPVPSLPAPPDAPTSPTAPVVDTGAPPADLSLSPLPPDGCPYPLDRYWDLVGYPGAQFWGSFEAIPGGFGCHLWLQADVVHQVDLRDPHRDGAWWSWWGDVRTSAFSGGPVLIEGLPDGPWALELRP